MTCGLMNPGPATPSRLTQHLSCGQYLGHLPASLPRACLLYPQIQGSSTQSKAQNKTESNSG